ncbi:hypothetical protein [Streptomyces colonosanans]|uniref:Lipoprotein n=1 Tax=Streptomyces colonosanans TaxID=1428652 RepID=A0A1S2P766_9ACTN|nr:hypothetical protein [Streptomyces colonosanans]OIJ89531.1 hypothetical protein BIV24_19655 [Streptomyces colonosanans]
MSLAPHSRTPLHRRSLLLASAAGAALLAGCSSTPDSAATGRSVTVADRARARAARDSAALAERYAAVISAHPALATRLRPLRAEVLRHAQAFGGGVDAQASLSATPKASASTSVSASPPPLPVPADPKAALVGLAAAERTLTDRRTRALLRVPGELARLMASVAAAGAAHAYLLTEGTK